MTIRELLKIIDLTNIKHYKINNIYTAFHTILSDYQNNICSELKINICTKKLEDHDVLYESTLNKDKIVIDDFDSIKVLLPDTSVYTYIELNFII
jgi:hypothetical protein